MQCKARSKRSGIQCKRHATRGYEVCYFHGAHGGAPKGNVNRLDHGVYSQRPLKCGNCVIADSCEKFKEGEVCAYEKGLQFDIKNLDDCIAVLNQGIQSDLIAVARGRRHEAAQGGIIDDATLRASGQLTKKLETIGKLIAIRDAKVIEMEKEGITVNVQQVISPTLKELLDGASNRVQVIRVLREATRRIKA
jgi:hypothetical protein